MNDAATTSPARLTGTQRKHLRGLAHALEPVVHVGRSGVTERVFSAVRQALADHELIKVKIAADREGRAAAAAEIEKACDAEVVGLVGTIAIVYREQPDPEKRTIVVPRRPAAGASSDDDAPAT